MGIVCKNLNKIIDTEKYLIKSIELSIDMEKKWIPMSALTMFYIENNMLLKAEKNSKLLIEEYPNNYQGYHMHILIEILKKNYDDVCVYMKKVPEKFQTHPQFLIDYVDLYRQQNKMDELYKFFEEDFRFTEIIPQEVLKEKMISLDNIEELYDEKEKILLELAKKYHDSDAIISLMILQFSKKKFEQSAKIANIILENEKNIQGIKYYLALYFQIYNLYFMSEKHPSVQLKKWIENAGNWCIRFANDFNIPEIANTVSDSIQELFDEINAIQ